MRKAVSPCNLMIFAMVACGAGEKKGDGASENVVVPVDIWSIAPVLKKAKDAGIVAITHGGTALAE